MRVKEVSEAGGRKGGKERGQAAYIPTETSSSQPTSCPLTRFTSSCVGGADEPSTRGKCCTPPTRAQAEVPRRGSEVPLRHLPRVPVPPVSFQLKDDLSTSSRSFTASDAPAAASLRRGLVQVVTVLRFSSPEKDPLHSLPRPLGLHRQSGPIGSPRAGTGVLWR